MATDFTQRCVTSDGKKYLTFIILMNFLIACIRASYTQQRPRITSGPVHPMIGTINSYVTFNWTFLLLPSESWNQSVLELSFGIWEHPGYLQRKLMVIDRQGQILIRPNHESKLSCNFSMSDLQAAFTLHRLESDDQKQYGFHVELGLTRAPLTDAVMLYLQDPPRIINSMERKIRLNIGESLDMQCQAKGIPEPNVTWTKNGRDLVITNNTFIIKRARMEDSGLYTCKARSRLGEDKRQVLLTVNKQKERSGTNDRGSQMSSTIVVLAVSLSSLTIFVLLFGIFLFHRRYKANVPYVAQVNSTTAANL